MEALTFSTPRYEGVDPIEELRESLPLQEGERLEIITQSEGEGWVTLEYVVWRALAPSELMERYDVQPRTI